MTCEHSQNRAHQRNDFQIWVLSIQNTLVERPKPWHSVLIDVVSVLPAVVLLMASTASMLAGLGAHVSDKVRVLSSRNVPLASCLSTLIGGWFPCRCHKAIDKMQGFGAQTSEARAIELGWAPCSDCLP